MEKHTAPSKNPFYHLHQTIKQVNDKLGALEIEEARNIIDVALLSESSPVGRAKLLNSKAWFYYLAHNEPTFAKENTPESLSKAKKLCFDGVKSLTGISCDEASILDINTDDLDEASLRAVGTLMSTLGHLISLSNNKKGKSKRLEKKRALFNRADAIKPSRRQKALDKIRSFDPKVTLISQENFAAIRAMMEL